MNLAVSYAVRNLSARRARTALTAGGIALVVAAVGLFLALISSIKQTLSSTGEPRNLIVLRRGADTEATSAISLEAYRTLRFFEGVARTETGEPLASPELIMQPLLARRDGIRENVLVRGVEPMALQVHREIEIVEGRAPRRSQGEAIVGLGAARRYPGVRVGADIEVGQRTWRVVGLFSSGGKLFDSEIWVDARELADDARRVVPYSTLRLRAASERAVTRLVADIGADSRFGLEAIPEPDYYAERAQTANLLYGIVFALALLSGTAASFGMMNTMHAAVHGRRVEIGSLRALGFRRRAIALSFLTESLFVALLGFGVGALVVVMLTAAVTALAGGIGFPASTFTTMVVELRARPGDLLAAMGLALGIALAGGTIPALRAASLPPAEALRRT